MPHSISLLKPIPLSPHCGDGLPTPATQKARLSLPTIGLGDLSLPKVTGDSRLGLVGRWYAPAHDRWPAAHRRFVAEEPEEASVTGREEDAQGSPGDPKLGANGGGRAGLVSIGSAGRAHRRQTGPVSLPHLV